MSMSYEEMQNLTITMCNTLYCKVELERLTFYVEIINIFFGEERNSGRVIRGL